MTRAALALATFAALAACHHAKPVVAPQPQPDQPPAAKADTTPPKQADTSQDKAMSQGIALSGDIAELCGIKPAANASTNFDYDKDELTSDDRNILQQLATCMTSGKLKGKAVSLIGRADPRGTEEYNLGLGSRRASSVSGFLTRLGVQQSQLGVTTRGALDATGTDEAGYRADRRVDVQLKG
jgi:peptidoglycan-associated lipoprotein